MTCPQCGAQVGPLDDFCGNCGTYLGWGSGGGGPAPATPSTAPRVEPPRAEPPRAEPPRAEPPRVEPPRAEPPRAEPPRAAPEPPRAEPPKAEPPAPRPEPPRAEPPTPPRAEPPRAFPPRAEPTPVEPPRAEPPSPTPLPAAPPSDEQPKPSPAEPAPTATPPSPRPEPTGSAWSRFLKAIRWPWWGGRSTSFATTGATRAATPTPFRPADPTSLADRAPGDLGPVLPGLPEARRPEVTTPIQDNVVGPRCPNCGTANPPDRRFCRRCATPLHPEQRAGQAGGKQRRRWRGDRSRLLRRLAAIAAIAALLIAGYLFYPRAVDLWQDTLDKLATPAPVGPAGTAASAQLPDHPSNLAVDGASNRYWGAPAVGDSIEFTFAEPFRLLALIVHTGAAEDQQQFAAQGRASSLDVVTTAEDGSTRTERVELADKPGPQQWNTGISDVVRIRLVITGAAGQPPGGHIALGEVEFFRRP
ncbi:zinc-ribbon domain [Actinosynnema pretiosum]|nr:zinc-ribbon domain [Actinosynnema pretiosum]